MKRQTFAVAAAAVVLAFAGGWTTADCVRGIDPDVAANANQAATALVSRIQAINDEGYRNIDVPQGPDSLLGGIPAEAAVATALTHQLDHARSAAGALAGGSAPLTVDKITVKQSGRTVVTWGAHRTVTATVELLITRHLKESGINSAEIIPHMLVLDPDTGVVTNLIVHDDEYLHRNRHK